MVWIFVLEAWPFVWGLEVAMLLEGIFCGTICVLEIKLDERQLQIIKNVTVNEGGAHEMRREDHRHYLTAHAHAHATYTHIGSNTRPIFQPAPSLCGSIHPAPA